MASALTTLSAQITWAMRIAIEFGDLTSAEPIAKVSKDQEAHEW